MILTSAMCPSISRTPLVTNASEHPRHSGLSNKSEEVPARPQGTDMPAGEKVKEGTGECVHVLHVYICIISGNDK